MIKSSLQLTASANTQQFTARADLFLKSILECEILLFEPRHEISNNVVCATNKASDQPAHTRSLIRAFASRLNI